MATAFQNLATRIMADLILDFRVSPEQAAGIVGNLAHESGGFTVMQEKNPRAGRGGLGWAQWTGPRRVAFESWTKSRGLAIDSYAANYGYLKAELSGAVQGFDYRKAITQVKKTSTVKAATETFEAYYEKAGVKAMASRVSWANQAMALWQAKRPEPPVSKPLDIPKDIAAQFAIVAQLAELQNSGATLSQAQTQSLRIALLAIKAWITSIPALRPPGEPAPMPPAYSPPSLPASPFPEPGALPDPKPELGTKRIQGLIIAALGVIGGAVSKRWFPQSENVVQSFLVNYAGEITTAVGVVWAWLGHKIADAPIAGTPLAREICDVKSMLANAHQEEQAIPYEPEPIQAVPETEPLDLMTAPIEDVVEQLPRFFERIKRIQATLNTMNQARLPTAKPLEVQPDLNEG